MWEGRAQSRCRCGSRASGPGAEVGGVRPSVDDLAGASQSPIADVARRKAAGKPDDESVGAREADVVEVDMHFPPLDLPAAQRAGRDIFHATCDRYDTLHTACNGHVSHRGSALVRATCRRRATCHRRPAMRTPQHTRNIQHRPIRPHTHLQAPRDGPAQCPRRSPSSSGSSLRADLG